MSSTQEALSPLEPELEQLLGNLTAAHDKVLADGAAYTHVPDWFKARDDINSYILSREAAQYKLGYETAVIDRENGYEPTTSIVSKEPS